jgi:lycopene cyclase domain-containing protein
MHYTYLLIDIFTVVVPLVTSFAGPDRFYRCWPYFFPGLLFSAIVFLVWDYYMTLYGVWGFDDRYILGVKCLNLPLEEIFFFITVPYSCTFIYHNLARLPIRTFLPKSYAYIFTAIGLFLLLLSFIFSEQTYTFSVFAGLGIILPLSVLVLNREQMNRFVVMYLISLLPMFIVNGMLTSLPVVWYDDSRNLGLRIGTIPVEDFAYSAILLIMNITIYEWLLGRRRVDRGVE